MNMDNKLQFTPQYKDWLKEVKERIRRAQQKVTLAANAELIAFYWDLGEDIFKKQQNSKWGKSFIEALSNDLRAEFIDMSGFSVRNLYNCVKFYTFYATDEVAIHGDVEFLQRSVAKIPWRHNVLIVSKSKTVEEALFYINQTLENGWSMDLLALQIK